LRQPSYTAPYTQPQQQPEHIAPYTHTQQATQEVYQQASQKPPQQPPQPPTQQAFQKTPRQTWQPLRQPADITNNEGTKLSKKLQNLGKIYLRKEDQFGGELYNVLNAKLKIFVSYCFIVGFTQADYYYDYKAMLKNEARSFYFEHIEGEGFIFEQMVAKTKKYFHIFEKHLLYFTEWRIVMLKDVMAANFEKDISWCLEYVIGKFRKLY
jgi:hypothetical protein